MRWPRKREHDQAIKEGESLQHLEEARRERERVEQLAQFLKARRLQNDFGQLFDAAMRGRA
jgi:hypothetical protein